MLLLEIEAGLILKSMHTTEAESVLDCIRENTEHLQAWIPWINPQSHLQQVEDFIHQQLQALEHQEGLMLGLYQDDILIGMAGLQDWNHQLAMAELGFWISKKHLSKGIMTKAVKRLLQFGFKDMQLQRITATFPISNLKAHKLLENAGFKLEGVLRNHILHRGLKSHMVVMGYLTEEWIG